MMPNETLLKEAQETINALAIQLVSVNAAIARVGAGCGSWITARDCAQEAVQYFDVCERRLRQTAEHLNYMVQKAHARRLSNRTGVPVNEVIAVIARKMGSG